MFSRIIIATDLSPASFAVVNCLGGLRALGAQHCLLLQCLNLRKATSTALSYTTAPLEVFLEQQKDILEKQGFEVRTRIVPGFAKREINRIAAEENCSLVVIGSHGHSMLAEVLLGGVAYEVIHSARKPVLVVRLEKEPETDDECVHASRCDFSAHVLFPTDFSKNSDLAFTYVQKLASSGARRITLLHVLDEGCIDLQRSGETATISEIDRARLEQMKDLLGRSSNSEIDIEVRYGSPFEQITKLVRERDVSLVVMGSQGRGFVEEVFLGSVSHNVVRQSGASVLLIPAVGRSQTGH